MKTKIVLFASLVLTLGPVGGMGAENDHLSYAIPPNASKTGPLPQRANGTVAYRYYAAVRGGEGPQLVAEEIFTDAVLTERWLMRDNERHGILRWTPKVGQDGSLNQNPNNDPHVQETTSA